MWQMRWVTPVVAVLSLSGCDDFKDCGGFWDKTFGSESCDYKQQLVQPVMNGSPTAIKAEPTKTSVEAAFQAGVKAIPEAEQAQWTALEKLPADEMDNEFISAFKVTTDPHLSSGDVFIVNGIAYQATIIESGDGFWIVHTSQPDINAVFKTLNMTGQIPLTGSDVAPVALQAGAATDPAGGTTLKFDPFEKTLKLDSEACGKHKDGNSNLNVVLGQRSIEAASLSGLNGATVNFDCKGTGFDIGLPVGKNGKSYSSSSSTTKQNHFNGNLDYKGELGFYGNITFNEYSPLSEQGAKNIAITGYSYVKADVTADLDYQLHQTQRIGQYKKNVIVYVPTPVGVPVPVVVSFYFFADMLLDGGLAANATLHVHNLSKVEWSASNGFTSSKIKLNDTTPLLSGTAEGTAALQVRPSLGVGVAGAIPAALGIPVGAVAEFISKGKVEVAADGITIGSCASLKISPLAGLDFILNPQTVKKNGLGYNYTKNLSAKVFPAVFEKIDESEGGECLLSPMPVATVTAYAELSGNLGEGLLQYPYLAARPVSQLHFSPSGSRYLFTAANSKASSGGKIESYRWQLFHTQSKGGVVLDTPENYKNVDQESFELAMADVRVGDYVTLVIKDKKTIRISEKESKEVVTERSITESIQLNRPPIIAASLTYDIKTQQLVMSVKGSVDDGTNTPSEGSIDHYYWCFEAQNQLDYCLPDSNFSLLSPYTDASGKVLDVTTITLADIKFANQQAVKRPLKARVWMFDKEGAGDYVDVSEGVVLGHIDTVTVKPNGELSIPLPEKVFFPKDIGLNIGVRVGGKPCEFVPDILGTTDAYYAADIKAKNCPLAELEGGVYDLEVSKNDVVIGEGKAIVNPVSRYQPFTAIKDEVTTFTLTGKGFTTNMAYTVTNCADVKKISHSATTIEFSCKPLKLGVEHIILKDKSGETGTVLFDNTVPIGATEVIKVSPTAPVASTATTFSLVGTVIDNVKAVVWRVGDTIISTLASMADAFMHLFDKSGSYTVSATVKDTAENNVATATTTVNVSAPPPLASLVGSAITGVAGQPVTFVIANSLALEGQLCRFMFDNGEGLETYGSTPDCGDLSQVLPLKPISVPYTTEGTYTATLTVTDSQGKSATATWLVNVSKAVTTVATGLLNDTGITQCSDQSTWFANCTAATLGGWAGYNQDAQVGRDSTAITKVGAGDAGFDFTKISATGQPLAANATEWSCVRDNHTGLMWEVKTDDSGTRDKDNTYTWYNPDTTNNGGTVGYENGGNNTHAFAQAVNDQKLCGFTNWRLPTKQELHSIVNYGKYNPAIDSAYFPNTQSSWYWSSSPVANYSSYAWIVYFGDGYDSYNYKGGNDYVRLVRSGQ